MYYGITHISVMSVLLFVVILLIIGILLFFANFMLLHILEFQII